MEHCYYSVCYLAWKSLRIDLPGNFSAAFGRIKSLSGRLQPNDRSLLQQYSNVSKSYIEAGIIELVMMVITWKIKARNII